MKLQYFTIATFALLYTTSCNTSKKDTLTQKTSPGIDLSSMELNINPCEDFYTFTGGNWIKNNPIPDSESKWSSFNVVRDRNDSILRNILETASNQKHSKGTNLQKIGSFYRMAMDTVKLQNDGIKPIRSILDKLYSVKEKSDLLPLLADYNKKGMDVFMYSEVYRDAKNSQQYTVYNGPGSLGLPERDYYLLNQPEFTHLREEYEVHVTNMFKLMGYSESTSILKAAIVLKMETALAKASLSSVERRDPDVTYNKFLTGDLAKKFTDIALNTYLKALGLNISELIISEPKFVLEVNNIFKTKDIEDIKTFIEWRIISDCSSKLSSDFENENFHFYGTTLRGVKEIKPRWKRVLSESNNSLKELLGQEYVKVAFTEENKKKVNEMVDQIILVMEQRIKNLDWMTDATKQQALKKLSTLNRKLGYPDVWLDYSALNIEDDAYVLNWFRCNEFYYQENLKKLGKPIDKNEWFISPQIVNAYYNPLYNEIVFPAGILQPPFFDSSKDDAINYGSMGAVIGHEITHGFDDKGNKFDSEGNLNDWWTEEDRNKFNEKAKVLVNQYSSYEVLDSVYINGELTLGENIADVGGLSIAFEAYKNSLKDKESVLIDGYTPEQRFFIAFGQVWKNNIRDKALREMVMTDPHSPGKYRVIGVLANMSEFEDAFGCKNPNQSEKVKIW